jgi:hypothetical protein
MKTFSLTRENIDYQLTVFRSNYEKYNGAGVFEDDVIAYRELGVPDKNHHLFINMCQIHNIIEHYGWFTVIEFIDRYKLRGVA